jgi:hypothetical protein
VLARLGIGVEIRALSCGVAITTPMPGRRQHAACEHIERFWEALGWTDGELEELSG